MLSERYLVRNKARRLKQNEKNMLSERYLVRNKAGLLKQNDEKHAFRTLCGQKLGPDASNKMRKRMLSERYLVPNEAGHLKQNEKNLLSNVIRSEIRPDTSN